MQIIKEKMPEPQLYDESYYHARYPDYYKNRYVTKWPWALYVLKPKAGENIVDIGTGTGHIAWLISRCKAHVKSIDISEYAITQARQYYSSDNLKFECCDILTTPLSENTYDAAMLLETLEHISREDSLKMLRNVCNSINKDGRIIVSCPLNQFTLRGKLRNAVLVILRRPPFDPTHVRNITETSLREDFQISGFEVVSVSYLLFERYIPFIQHIPILANFLAGGIVVEGRKRILVQDE